MNKRKEKIQNYRLSFFFNTLIEELRVVKGLITLALFAIWKSTLSVVVFVHRVWIFAYLGPKGHCALVFAVLKLTYHRQAVK